MTGYQLTYLAEICTVAEKVTTSTLLPCSMHCPSCGLPMSCIQKDPPAAVRIIFQSSGPRLAMHIAHKIGLHEMTADIVSLWTSDAMQGDVIAGSSHP